VWVLATDIDNTLTGQETALRELAAQLDALQRQELLFLILATGRRLEQVLSGFAGEGLPRPKAIISQVGTEIYLPPFAPEMAPLAAWKERLLRSFSRRRALRFLEGIEGLEMQPEMYNTALKVSVFLHRAPDPEAAAALVRERVAASDADDQYRVVWSSGKHLDIIPAQAGKGNAIQFLLEHKSLDAQRLVVAGDSGNDLSMFRVAPRGIVVANAQPELQRLRDEAHEGLFFATAECAAGVAQGLRHFGILRETSSARES